MLREGEGGRRAGRPRASSDDGAVVHQEDAGYHTPSPRGAKAGAGGVGGAGDAASTRQERECAYWMRGAVLDADIQASAAPMPP